MPKKNRSTAREGRKGGRPDPEKFLRNAGTWRAGSQTNFWSRLETSFGRDYCDEVVAVTAQRPDQRTAADWDVLTRTLDTTRATYAIVAPMAEQWLKFWSRLDLPPGDVVDLGCGAGLYTCYYAATRPDARVVGLDPSGNSIARARELARHLRLDNVTFVEGDVLDGAAELGKYSVAVSSLMLTEAEPAVATVPDNFSTLRSIERGIGDGPVSRVSQLAANLIDGGGRYVSLERLGTPEAVAHWVGALGRAGLGVDLEQSDYVRYKLFEMSQTLPVVVAGPDLAVPDPDVFTAWALRRTGDSAIAAESRIRELRPHMLAKGWQLDTSDARGEGEVRIVVAVGKGDVPFAYETNSRGGRKLDERRPGDLELLLAEKAERVRWLLDAPDVVAVRELDRTDEL